MLVEDMVIDFGSEVVGPVARMDHAISRALSAELDAAILDINVGGSVVFPVAEILDGRGVPVIFATGYGPAGLPARFRGRPVLPKPFSNQSLAAALRGALAGRPCHTEAV